MVCHPWGDMAGMALRCVFSGHGWPLSRVQNQPVSVRELPTLSREGAEFRVDALNVIGDSENKSVLLQRPYAALNVPFGNAELCGKGLHFADCVDGITRLAVF